MLEHVRVSIHGSAPALAAFAALSLSCGGDPHGPGSDSGPATPVALGDTIAGSLPARAEHVLYSFRVAEASELAVFGTADGSMFLRVLDSALASNPGDAGLAGVHPHSVDGSTLTDRRTGRFQAQPGRTYLIRAEHTQVPVDVRFSFLIYRIDRAPEHRAAAIASGEVVEGEWLENSADIDEFLLQAEAGTELVGFIQGSDSMAQGTVGLTVIGADGAELGSVAHLEPQSDIEAQQTGTFVVAAGGAQRFVVQGGATTRLDDGAIAGSYRILAHTIDRAPEQGSPSVALGDTVPGTIDHVGDVDEYTLTGEPGRQFNLFIQALTETSTTGCVVEVRGGTPGDVIYSLGADTSLSGQVGRRITFPDDGMVTLQVAGYQEGPGLPRGPFRFFAYPIDPSPEDAAPGMAPGSSAEDAIELPGDVDEYLLTVPTDGEVNLVLEPLDGNGAQLDLSWLTPAGEYINGFRLFGEAGMASGLFAIAAGDYRLRVEGESSGAGYRGGYRLSAHGIDGGPESISSTVSIGVMKMGESVAPLGDYDRFTLNAARGDVLTIWFQPLGAPSDHGIGLGIWAAGRFEAIAGTGQTFGGDSVETGRFFIPETGPYEIRVDGDGRFPGNEGPYWFTVRRLDTDPEQVSAGIAPGATVTAEALDFPGDVDEFVLTAAPGTELQATLHGPPERATYLDVERPVTYESVKSTLSAGFRQATGLFAVPAGGQLRLRVYQHGDPVPTAPYTLSVFAIQRAPEVVPAALPTEVVVTGEALDPVGDIDEYTFHGDAGETVNLHLNTPNGFDVTSPALLEVLASGSETVLGSVSSGNPAPTIFHQSTGPITLPVTGTYRVRVRATQDQYGTGNYEMYLRR